MGASILWKDKDFQKFNLAALIWTYYTQTFSIVNAVSFNISKSFFKNLPILFQKPLKQASIIRESEDSTNLYIGTYPDLAAIIAYLYEENEFDKTSVQTMGEVHPALSFQKKSSYSRH